MEAWYMRVNIGVISVLHIFKIVSRNPGALEMSNSFTRLKTQSTSIEKAVILDKGESWIDGSVSDELCAKKVIVQQFCFSLVLTVLQPASWYVYGFYDVTL